MVRDDLPIESNPFDEPLPFLEPKANGQQRFDELPDDWFDFDLQQINVAHGAADNGEAASSLDADDAGREQDFIVKENAQQVDGYIEQREHAKTKRTVIGVVVVLLVVAGLVFGFVSGAFSNLFKIEPEQQLVSSGVSTSSIVEINVVADGYDEHASPIVYHLVGGPSDDSVVHVDRYGIVPAVSDAGKLGNVGSSNVFNVTFDDLPEGSYTVSWSISFLLDGSILRAPDEMVFKVSRGDAALTAEFERVDAAIASVDEVRAAYAQLGEWLAIATGDVANMRDAILETAHRNAETAPAVVAAGGLDGNAVEEGPQANVDEDETQNQQQDVVAQPVVEQAAPEDNADETVGNQDEGAVDNADDTGDASESGDDGEYGFIQYEPIPEPTPVVEPEPAPSPTSAPEPSTNPDTSETS